MASFVLWTTTQDRTALPNKTSPDVVDLLFGAVWIGLGVWLTTQHRGS